MIRLRNVCVNNLKQLDLDIPLGQLLLFCGPSGSGKSSLALDTLYAEGQRRYIECLAPQSRQFLTLLDRPDAELIEGLPPAIAVQANRGRVGAKATVGTATEISDYLQVLLAQLAEAWCEKCQRLVQRDQPETVANRLEDLPQGTRFQVVFQFDTESPLDAQLTSARGSGFGRAIVAGRTINLSDPAVTATNEQGPLRIVVDRLQAGSTDSSRLVESLETAFQFGRGRCEVLLATDQPGLEVDHRQWQVLGYSRELACSQCGQKFPDPEPRRFNHLSAHGACSTCEGRGTIDKFDRQPCDDCDGSRLNALSRSFRIEGTPVKDVFRMRVAELGEIVVLPMASRPHPANLTRLLEQLRTRIEYLEQVGLGYLPLHRSAESLSSGEGQRVTLTSCLSSTLVNALYVLDEPSVGLHVDDTPMLLQAIERLHQRGNTVIVVDHEEALIRAMPRVVELGPAAGAGGGEIVFDGTPEQLEQAGDSLTADFLAGRRGVSFNQQNRRSTTRRLRLTGARGHNLRNLDVAFPLGCLTVVTGVSGSGKSSLVQQTLYPAVRQRKQQAGSHPLPFDDVMGDSLFDEIVLVDRTPIGRSARSNPVTYIKVFDEIRRCFADTVDAKSRNMGIGKFSFNAAGGRCDRCEGAGHLTIDMQFLPEIKVTCEQCAGTRYGDDVLTVKYRGCSIADVLNLTVREAFSFFRGQPKIQSGLKSLIDVGLDYIGLGQPATTLSAGEAQRLKLAFYLNTARSKRALFLMDEPTSGLHMADVTRLLDCFDTLLSVGHSLIVIEHHLRVIKSADWIIDLGPGAGEAGGNLMAEGTPEQVATQTASRLARHLVFD